MIMNKFFISFLILFSSTCFSDVWIDKAKIITIKYQLTTLDLFCVDFERSTLKGGEKILITTFEIHSDICSGDPETRPKLFFIEFDNINNTIKTNAKSEVGQMEVVEYIE